MTISHTTEINNLVHKCHIKLILVSQNVEIKFETTLYIPKIKI